MFYYRGVFFLFHAHRDFRPIECAATAHVASLGIGVNQWQGSSKDDEAKVQGTEDTPNQNRVGVLSLRYSSIKHATVVHPVHCQLP